MGNCCTLYIVRHGETDWNIKGLMQGQTDVTLNQAGIKQAKELAKRLKNIHFNAVFSSDLLRARRTAEIISLERKLAIKTTQILRERSFGKFEGLSYKEYGNQLRKMFDKFEKLSIAKKQKFKFHPTIESDEELLTRLTPLIREIAVAYPGKNVLIVTHGGLMRAFLTHLGYISYERRRNLVIRNTAYFKLQSDGVDFFIKELWGIEEKN